MTEKEWQTATHPSLMMRWYAQGYAGNRRDQRKPRLFVEACLIPNGHSRLRWADWVYRAKNGNLSSSDMTTVDAALYFCGVKVGQNCMGVYNEDRINRANLLREIFGNPFHVQQLQPRRKGHPWLTRDVLALARIAEEGDWSVLPFLADALMDAGCQNPVILDHLQAPGHVEGCWAVDLLLGNTD